MKKASAVVSLIMAAALCFGGMLTWQPQTARAADEYDGLRGKWSDMLTGGSAINTADTDIAAKINSIVSQASTCNPSPCATGTGYWDKMDRSAGRTYLWSDLTTATTQSGGIDDTWKMVQRLKAMALAYATTGSRLKGNLTLKTDIVNALDWIQANRYNTTITKYGNWWTWEIGVPLELNDVTVLMYNDLTTTQISNYMAAIARNTPNVSTSGANRIWKATVVAVSGVILKDSAKLANARDGLSNVFTYASATGTDGFYRDGSFIQHGYAPYTGGYGKDLLINLSDVMYLLSGSTWAVTDPNAANVYRWIYDSYEPLIYKGAIMDMVRGREISRSYTSDHDAGHAVIRGIIRVSQFAPAADANAFRGMVKYWLQSDTSRNFYASESINMIVLAKQIVSTATSRGELVKHKNYPVMNRTVHLRPGFGVGLATSSNRIYNFEYVNFENRRAWYTSNGTLFLYNNDLAQYSGSYWATVNAYRMPGTTEDTISKGNGTGASYLSPSTWAGGTELLGLYGIQGMEYDAYGNNPADATTYSSLTAKKSYFMFDDEIVAVGSDINSTDNRTIETTVENRKLNSAGNNALTVNGTAKSTALGWTESMTGVNWAHMAGSVSGSDIGYYFPGGTSLKGIRETRTGNWNALNGGESNAAVTSNFLTLWMDHGANPSSASYQYVLLPNKSSSQVSAYAASPNVSILEKTGDAHAVKENSLNIIGVNFWKDMVKTVSGITSNKKASVMTRETSSDLEIAVADPTHANTGTIDVEINKSAYGVISADTGVTVTQTSPTIKLTVNVNASAGKTFKVKLGFSTGTPVGGTVTRIEAENYSSSGGLTLETTTDTGGGQNIGSAQNNDYAVYNSLNFGSGKTNLNVRIASTNSGGLIEFRLGSTTGTLIGSLTVASTGGWQTWQTKSVSLTGASGTQNLYMVFKNSTTSSVANVNWFEF